MSHHSCMSSAPFHLLIVEDDALVIESLKMILPKNWHVISAPSANEIPVKLLFHAAFVDMHLKKGGGAEGLEVIEQIASKNPQIEIIAISGDENQALMDQSLKKGAKKFISKPLVKDEVLSNLEKIEALWQLRETETRGGRKYQWLGTSTQSEQIKATLASLKGEKGPILIEGETGTGKEIAFRLLNQQEPNRPAITVNIASIPDHLFESELYGHVRGAFTGADTNKMGLCEAAHGGDLFLDEIEAMPLGQQVKLLRFLETGEIRRVGSSENTFIKTRVIAASNQNLAMLVKEGKFREDLLFRLNGKKVILSPLRERPQDIALLAEYFLSLERPRSNKKLSSEALELFQQYSWPGNVRELRRLCEQLALTSPLPIIRGEDIRPLIMTKNIQTKLSLSEMIADFESKIIANALEQYKDIEKVTEVLQISRSNLYKKIKDYNLQGGT